VFANRRPAGTMASRNGSATVTPIPLRTARRERRLLVRTMLSPEPRNRTTSTDKNHEPQRSQRTRRGAPWLVHLCAPRVLGGSGSASVVVASAFAVLNAGLFTTPRMNDDIRFPFASASRTIA